MSVLMCACASARLTDVLVDQAAEDFGCRTSDVHVVEMQPMYTLDQPEGLETPFDATVFVLGQEARYHCYQRYSVRSHVVSECDLL